MGRNVNIAKLKAELSACLRSVRAGEELVVMDRETPVARIVPYRPAVEPLDIIPAEKPGALTGIAIPRRRYRTDSLGMLLEDRRRR